MYCGLSWWIHARINGENILIPSFIRADGNSNENSPILLVFSKIKNQKKNQLTILTIKFQFCCFLAWASILSTHNAKSFCGMFPLTLFTPPHILSFYFSPFVQIYNYTIALKFPTYYHYLLLKFRNPPPLKPYVSTITVNSRILSHLDRFNQFLFLM